jgi:hypothetical protein
MSTKTLRKRIALVAVVALGAGVLATSPATAGNNNAVGGENVAPATNVLNVAVASSITGAATVSATPEDGATERNFSLGLLAASTTLTTSSVTSTATMRADGEIVFYTKTDDDVAATFEVVGGTFGTVSTQASQFNNVNAARTSFVTGKATAATQIAFSVKPNVGATTMTVSMFKSASLATIDQTKVNAVQAGTTSKGSLAQRYVVTIATTSASGTYSAAESLVNVDADGSGSATGIDEANANIIANGNAGYININLLDPYGVSLTGVGALVVTATNGAGIRYNSSGGASTPVNLTDVSNDTDGTITVARPSALADKGFTTTVTITWNGQVVGTK